MIANGDGGGGAGEGATKFRTGRVAERVGVLPNYWQAGRRGGQGCGRSGSVRYEISGRQCVGAGRGATKFRAGMVTELVRVLRNFGQAGWRRG